MDDQPGTNAVFRIGYTVFKYVDGLSERSHALHGLANAHRVRLSVGLLSAGVSLGNMWWNEYAGEHLAREFRIEGNMKSAVDVQPDEIAGPRNVRTVTVYEIQRKTEMPAFDQLDEDFVESFIDRPAH